MYLAQVKFGRAKTRSNRDDFENTAESYLVSLLRNGQLCGEYVFGWIKNYLIAYAYLARPNATKENFHSKWTKRCLTELFRVSGTNPIWKLLADETPVHFPSWKTAPSLCLFTAWTIHDPPVVRNDIGTPIPAYLLPLSEKQRDEIYSWAYSYRNHDSIWTESGYLEIPAYKELVEPTSELSEYGRHICRTIEKATGIPSFYYLFRYWGRKNEDTSRLCPGCGKKWVVKSEKEPKKSFWDFPYQCKKCRLVSDHACIDDDARYARIGEYKFK
jgi:predicted  nucleic acid-binding Zn ribbon protein